MSFTNPNSTPLVPPPPPQPPPRPWTNAINELVFVLVGGRHREHGQIELQFLGRVLCRWFWFWRFLGIMGFRGVVQRLLLVLTRRVRLRTRPLALSCCTALSRRLAFSIRLMWIVLVVLVFFGFVVVVASHECHKCGELRVALEIGLRRHRTGHLILRFRLRRSHRLDQQPTAATVVVFLAPSQSSSHRRHRASGITTSHAATSSRSSSAEGSRSRRADSWRPSTKTPIRDPRQRRPQSHRPPAAPAAAPPRHVTDRVVTTRVSSRRSRQRTHTGRRPLTRMPTTRRGPRGFSTTI